jgi:hypothetical protein
MADPTTSTSGGLGSLGSLGVSIYDLIQGLQGRSQNVGNTAASIANPNMPYAGGEAQELSQMFSDPSAFLNSPLYTTGLQAGMDAVNAGDSAAGLQDSGNRQLALQKYGENYFDQTYNMAVGQLENPAILGNPGEAAKQYMAGNTNNANQLSGGIAGLLNGMPGLLQLIQGGGGALSSAFNNLFGNSPIVPPNSPGATGLNAPAGSPDLLPGSPDVGNFWDTFNPDEATGGASDIEDILDW